ncbi:MAG TPA: CPBP family intramembrane glutamic endopeptidase [Clostridia bacterium]|nr:CPBP family intramembrane glutamic endopeptidase [Clostridia bacterium]
MGLDLRHMQMASQTTAQLFVTCFMGMVGTVGIVWLFTTKVDKKSFTSIGFDRTKVIKDIALGLAMGFVIMLSGYSILVLTHQLQFVDIKFNALNLVYSVGVFVFVAVSEEVFTRGYILRNLAVSFNKYVALVVSALIFSLMHLANPNANLVGLSIIFLSGLVLGLPYLYSKNLWFPIALHFSWNFFQGPIFGFNVSGLNFYKLIETKYATANNWNGGEFGFEGSILAIFFLLCALTAIYFLFRSRNAVEEFEVEELEVEIETT